MGKCKKCKKIINEDKNEGWEVCGYLSNITLLCDDCYEEFQEFETEIILNNNRNNYLVVYFKGGDIEHISKNNAWITYLNVRQEKKAERLMLKEFLKY